MQWQDIILDGTFLKIHGAKTLAWSIVSGSGVATAAGLAFATLVTLGFNTTPAAVCGTVGLKPTWGQVSRYGVLDLAQSLDHVGPLTDVIDAGLVMQVISGEDQTIQRHYWPQCQIYLKQ